MIKMEDFVDKTDLMNTSSELYKTFKSAEKTLERYEKALNECKELLRKASYTIVNGSEPITYEELENKYFCEMNQIISDIF